MKRIRKIQSYRVAVAYILLLAFMPFLFVKAFHVHKDECVIHSRQHVPASEEGCVICLFTLSAFTEAEIFEYHYLNRGIPVKRPVRKEKGVVTQLLFRPLRAPPLIAT